MSRRRFSLPVLAALAAAGFLLAAGILMARYEDRLYADQQVKSIGEQAHILAASVAGAVAFDDARAAQEYVDALKANPELQAASVFDIKDRRIAGFSRIGPLPDRPGSNATGNGHIDIAVPVTQNGAALGTVFLRAAAEPAQRRIARYIGLVLLVTMGALVIAVLSISQSALSRRAEQLALVNEQLQAEMRERAQTEEALRQAHKMEAVGQLSGGIAHDFNNLIMIVKGNLRLLKRKLGEDQGPAASYITSADEALDRAAYLTQRILAFSRRQPLTPQRVNLSTLAEGLLELLRHSVGEKVEISLRLNSAWPTLCDINQMENVILNLAINARDAMPNGGRMVIETSDETLTKPPVELESQNFVPGDYVSLAVIDTGVGMSEEVRRRAVDPFFTTKPQGKGPGLGLSMTFGFVRQSGGYLMIESAPDKGTAVTILMPRDREETV
jgi:signal transduction histidine kinase